MRRSDERPETRNEPWLCIGSSDAPRRRRPILDHGRTPLGNRRRSEGRCTSSSGRFLRFIEAEPRFVEKCGRSVVPKSSVAEYTSTQPRRADRWVCTSVSIIRHTFDDSPLLLTDCARAAHRPMTQVRLSLLLRDERGCLPGPPAPPAQPAGRCLDAGPPDPCSGIAWFFVNGWRDSLIPWKPGFPPYVSMRTSF